MLQDRSSGLLLHPTSLPGPTGIGDLGQAAYDFVDFLARSRQRYWQMLPLCPTAVGHSPYQSPSSFGGNPLLISLDRLAEDHLLDQAEVGTAVSEPELTAPRDRVDFTIVQRRSWPLIQLAASRLAARAAHEPLVAEFEHFRSEQAAWLGGHSLFFALRDLNGGRSWLFWDTGVTPTKDPLPEVAASLSQPMREHDAVQFLFFRQWGQLRQYARDRGVLMIGDLPIYVSQDSADVWANRKLFLLDEQGNPTLVAGVPPDYFSATGQLWNNPLYDWGAMEADGFAWWIARLRASLMLVDLVRLDHFRGFESYWAVPAGSENAINGQWLPGPAEKLLGAFVEAFTPGQPERLPIIAEDLGMITPLVDQLRAKFALPGMKVLQFLLPGDSWENYQPSQFESNSVVYTGTHDNDTTLGWFRTKIMSDPDRWGRLRAYTRAEEPSIARELIEVAWHAGSALAIAPVQDLLQLPTESRMNTPGTSGEATGNWLWRATPGLWTDADADWLAHLTERTGRVVR